MADLTPRRKLTLAVVAIVAAASCLWLYRYLSPEAAIARSFGALATAVESERITAVAPHISRRYHDDRGMTYETLLGAIHQLSETYDDLSVSLDVTAISISGRTAVAEVSLRVSGERAGQREAIVGELLDPARATVELREAASGWQIERTMDLDYGGD